MYLFLRQTKIFQTRTDYLSYQETRVLIIIQYFFGMEESYKKPQLITEWQCSVNNLSDSLYSRFQHASLYNPTRNSSLNISKLHQNSLANSRYISNGKYRKDHLFHNCNQYKLPIVQTFHRNKKQKTEKIVTITTKSIKTKKEVKKKYVENKFWHQKQTGRTTVNTKIKETQSIATNFTASNVENINWKQQIQIFKQSMYSTFKFTEKDKYFSFYFLTVQQICRSIQQSKQKRQKIDSLIRDIQLLLTAVDARKTMVTTLKQMLIFKKDNKYFQFKHPQIRILYHILVAEIQYYENKMDKSIFQFEFCEYYCRKQNMEILTMCFLWEIVCINVNLMKYDQADLCLRNLLEMAIICRQKRAIKFVFQKISIVYYYRGNSIMGHYYLNKSELGLSIFQADIYSRQYSKEDEIKRLEHRLFNFPLEQQIVKRKNNPKFQSDVWRESKEQHEKRVEIYMHSINQMLKDHEHCKLGQHIKKISNQIGFVGNCKIKQYKQSRSTHSFQRTSFSPSRLSICEVNQLKTNMNCSVSNLKNLEQLKNFKQKQNGIPKYHRKQLVQDNVTNVVKTHLSMNRQNTHISREHRWRKFVGFIFNLATNIKDLGHQKKEDIDSNWVKQQNQKTVHKTGSISTSLNSTGMKREINTL